MIRTRPYTKQKQQFLRVERKNLISNNGLYPVVAKFWVAFSIFFT